MNSDSGGSLRQSTYPWELSKPRALCSTLYLHGSPCGHVLMVLWFSAWPGLSGFVATLRVSCCVCVRHSFWKVFFEYCDSNCLPRYIVVAHGKWFLNIKNSIQVLSSGCPVVLPYPHMFSCRLKAIVFLHVHVSPLMDWMPSLSGWRPLLLLVGWRPSL